MLDVFFSSFFPFSVAVRFGRIPKREKQRMLAEMQSAMNNMANNQLTARCPPESLPAGHLQANNPLLCHQPQVAPCSPPPHTASPAQPSPCFSQFSQQLTPPRSPSPGDVMENVISQVAKAHKEIFVYAHDKLATGPPPSTRTDSSAHWENSWLINGGHSNGICQQNDNWNSGSVPSNTCHQNNINGHRFCPSGYPSGDTEPSMGQDCPRQGKASDILLVSLLSTSLARPCLPAEVYSVSITFSNGERGEAPLMARRLNFDIPGMACL